MTKIPAGQTGGPPLPPEQRKEPGPNDRLPPRRMGPAIGGFAPGQFMRVYQEGSAMKLPAGRGLTAGAPGDLAVFRRERDRITLLETWKAGRKVFERS